MTSNQNAQFQTSQSTATLNMAALGKLYPNNWNATKDGAPCAEYSTSDSEYRTKQPSWVQNADGGGTATMLLDHIRGGSKDDHATLMVTFLSTGQLYSSSLNWSLGGTWAIEWAKDIIVWSEGKINDKASEEAGKLAVEMADLLSEGALAPLDPLINKAASEMTSKLIASLFSNLNVMLTKELDHDDGGRQTFIAVVNHNMNKLCNSIVTSPALALPNTSISFNTGAFPGKLYETLYAAYGSTTVEKSVSWDGDNTTEYYVQDDNPQLFGNSKFSTWKQDFSGYPLKEGLYVSTKIDLKHGSAAKDGHFVVMVGFSSNGQINSAQASLIFPPPYNVDSYLSPVFSGTDADAQLVADIRANKSVYSAPNTLKMNIDAMRLCITTSSN